MEVEETVCNSVHASLSILKIMSIIWLKLLPKMGRKWFISGHQFNLMLEEKSIRYFDILTVEFDIVCKL